jgi:hypothetical protein
MLALAMASCASAPQAQVVRFHTGQPIARGTIAIVPANQAMAGSLEFQAQANAIAPHLKANGFVVVQDPAAAQFLAQVDVATQSRQGQGRRSNVSVGMGGGFGTGGFGGSGVGVGTSVQVPVTGRQPPGTVTATSLSVSIVDRQTKSAIWEGRASTDGGNNQPSGTAAVPQLANAMFQTFPGPSGTSTSVRL